MVWVIVWEGNEEKAIEYEFSDGTLETHIKNITEKFVTERELKFGEFQFVLQTTTGTKLTEENFLSIVGEQEKPKESTEPTQENEEEKEEEKPNKMLILVGNPLLVRNLELETKVRNDTENLMNIKNLKDHLYKLGSNLQVNSKKKILNFFLIFFAN